MNCIPTFWGMHLFWWFFWLIVLLWIFAIPYDIPGSRKSKATALDILKQRLASGQINEEEFERKKKLLQAQ